MSKLFHLLGGISSPEIKECDAMVTFLYVLGSFGLLVVLGLAVSLYLYHGGAIGRKHFVRSRNFRALAFETAVEDDSQYQFYMGTAPADGGATSRFARNGLIVLLASLVIIVAFVSTFVGAVVH
jgi:hypothetical protein